MIKVLQMGVMLSVSFNYFQQGADWSGTCSIGQRQSPIDIREADLTVVYPSDSSYQTMDLAYNPVVAIGKDLGDTFKVRDDFGGVFVNGISFESVQFHFHAPSEHTFEGEHHDLEMKIGHSDGNGKILMLAIFFDASASAEPNDFIDAALASEFSPTEIDFNQLFQSNELDDFIYYDGSLTTPTCDEIASFALWTKVQTLTPDQLEEFNKRWKDNALFAGGNGNNRATQPLNSRTVYHYKGEPSD